MRWSPRRPPARRILVVSLVITGASCHDAMRSVAPPNDTLQVSLSRRPGSLAAATAVTPTIYPTDGSYGWSFDGSTDVARSGAFTAADLATPFLTASGSSSGWLWAAGQGPGQINAVDRVYPVSSSSVGPSFYYVLPSTQKKLFVRFLYQQSNPFNSDGTTSNLDSLALVRFGDQNDAQILTAGALPAGLLAGTWNGGWTRQPTRAATFNLDSALGRWTCYEVMVDLSVRRSAHATIWMNDTLVLDNTITGRSVPSSRTAVHTLRFDGAINSMRSSSTAWFTSIGVSSQRMGCPPSNSPPPPPPPPSAASRLSLSTQPPSSAQSGVVFTQQPVVQLVDSAGNAVSQSGVTVTTTIASGGGTLGGTASRATDSTGKAVFSDLSITGTVGTHTLGFSSGSLTSAVSNAINLTPGPATHLAITTQPSATAQSGTPFPQQPVVQLLDGASNSVSQSGVSVTAAVASGGGTLSGTTTISTGTNGAATFTDLAITGSGAQTLQFTSAGLTGATSASVTVSATSGGGGGTVLFQENFEDTNFGSRGWYDLPSGGITSLSTAQHISGSTHSLQMSWTQGGTSPSPSTAARHQFTPTNSVYIRYWVLHSSNWVGSGQTYHPHLFYFMTTEDDAYVGPAWNHLTGYIEDNFASDGGHAVINAQDAQNIDVNHINQDLTSTTENRAVSGCNGNPDSAPEITCYSDGTNWFNGKTWRSSQVVFSNTSGTANYKGTWHKVEAYLQLNSIVNGVGQLDGVAQYWVDGVLVIDQHNLQFRTGAHPNMQFNQLLLGPYMDSSPVAQTLWIDDMVVMTAPPSP